MKYILPVLALVFAGCHGQGSTPPVEETQSRPLQKERAVTNNSSYYTNQDSVWVTAGLSDSTSFKKEVFNKFVDHHPEFFAANPANPDLTYYRFANKGAFGSEAGQDRYYNLYAHFLKIRNGETNYDTQRKTLTNLYSDINALFERLQHGGTYFGHQYWRISAYAEYSVYLYKTNERNFTKSYSIAAQKNSYIHSLRQLVDDEISIDSEIPASERPACRKELNAIVDGIAAKITTLFYLRRAQAFQHEMYEYY
jgi:hypothetical protein